MDTMKSFLVSTFVLSALVNAAPIAEANVVVTEIVTETHWTTIDCVSTVWLPADQSPAPTTKSTTSQVTTTIATSSPQGQSTIYRTTSSSPVAPSYAPTTTVYVPPPAPTTTYSPAPPPPPTTSAYTSPALVTTAQPSPYVAPTTEAPAPQPTTTAAAAPESSPGSAPGNFVSASPSNNCEGPGSACEGEITHYDGGLGACGWNVDTESELSVALPKDLMGTQSNGNPFCGRTITIKNPNSGTTMQAKVGDKCMGCVGKAIDLTNKLFQAITDGTGDGRESGYQWWFD